ncbi:class I SAM-dependent methyltransferase [Mesorhizobium sp. PAMC28654]|uniref:class I SAM-dependent methyltransferase n=1 Tax=Mesorhizobium sp. PAMC28654 TaxID=2880934 RepID=UPI001D0AD4D9|nr:class I SAM-dependent methyltransferase [Mesorhizobium sp. PAMC28654]UDL89016.1 class I SAM-dependent methyltransferase [Mesorhizobium sp. PAMC28654]
MANLETRRLDRDGVEDRSSGRLGRAWALVRQKGLLEPVRLVRRHGVGASVGFVLRNVRHVVADHLARKWDRRHGVDTAGSIQLDALDVVGPHRAKGNEAVCTSPRSFDFIMKSLPHDLQNHTFIDIGSGKSRTLLLASRYPFQNIIGVEFARELVEIAKRNINSFRDASRKCRALSVVQADAAAYEFPETPLVVYFYNPFSSDVFEIVLKNLVSSLARHPRDCFIVYGSSSHRAIDWARPAIRDTGMFTELAVPPMPGFLDAVRTIDYAVFRVAN